MEELEVIKPIFKWMLVRDHVRAEWTKTFVLCTFKEYYVAIDDSESKEKLNRAVACFTNIWKYAKDLTTEEVQTPKINKMTNFIDNTTENRVVKKTVFTKEVNSDSIAIPTYQPENYTNVEFIGRDDFYGNVFKAWDSDPCRFRLYFGEKGDEFN